MGGHDVDLELLNRVQDALTDEAAEEVERNRFYYLQQIRALKEFYCRGLPLYPLMVVGAPVELGERDIQEVLEARFIQQSVESLKDYLHKISRVDSASKPSVLLVGGSARIRGLKEALEDQCGCRALWWEHSEFATVLGALPASAPGASPDVFREYRTAVEFAWLDRRLDQAKAERLASLAEQLGLSEVQTADIEREVMGETREALLEGSKPGEVIRDELKDGSLGPEMVVVPEGRFQMGSPPSELGRDDDEGPLHWVTISEPFAIGRHPVTVDEFRRFVKATGYQTEAEQKDGAYVWDGKNWDKKSDANWRNPYMPQDDDHPLVCVSWKDAAAYCEWLCEQTGEQYLLPTEVQWEYACRSSSETAYCFGDDEQQLGEYAWYWKNAEGGTHPVEQKRVNQWGLYDMHGNVFEWVQDWYGPYSEEPQQDPSGSEQGSSRVIRGGSWLDDAGYCRSACRYGIFPGYRLDFLGFRPARRV